MKKRGDSFLGISLGISHLGDLGVRYFEPGKYNVEMKNDGSTRGLPFSKVDSVIFWLALPMMNGMSWGGGW